MVFHQIPNGKGSCFREGNSFATGSYVEDVADFQVADIGIALDIPFIGQEKGAFFAEEVGEFLHVALVFLEECQEGFGGSVDSDLLRVDMDFFEFRGGAGFQVEDAGLVGFEAGEDFAQLVLAVEDDEVLKANAGKMSEKFFLGATKKTKVVGFDFEPKNGAVCFGDL